MQQNTNNYQFKQAGFQEFHDEQDQHRQSITKGGSFANKQHVPSAHYNPLVIPPNWDFAKRHGLSRRTAKEKILDNGKMQEVCPCCGYEIDRQDIAMCDPTSSLAFLGSGYPLFYNYIKYSIMILLTLALFESLPNLFLYQQGTFCKKSFLEAAKAIKENEKNPDPNFKNPCSETYLLLISMANIIDTKFPPWQIYMQIAVQALVMIELMIFRYHQRKIDQDVDSQMTTPADYSIIVKNIPHGLSGEQIKFELKQQIEKNSMYNFNKKVQIKKIVPVFLLDDFEHKEHEIKETVKSKQKLLEANGVNLEDPEVQKLDHKIEKLEEELEEVSDRVMNDPKAFANIAFVSFQGEAEKAAILSANQISTWQRIRLYFKDGHSEPYLKNDEGKNIIYWKDRHLYIEQAPEPNDVDWEFIHETTYNRRTARFKSDLKQMLLQVFCFATIYIISYGQSLQIDKAYEAIVENEDGADFKYNLVRVISVIISAIIVLINKFWLGGQVHHIVDHEKWSTKTKLNISFARKLTLALFSNTALITLAVEIVTFGNYYGVGGMISCESMVFFFNALVPPLAWAVDPWHIKKVKKRKIEIEKGNKSVLTQEEANDLCEDTIYINGKRYADMMKTMWFTFFYTPIVPIGTVFSLIGLMIYYWVDKYNVVKRRTVKETISIDLTVAMIDYLEYIVILHAVGDFMFKRALFGFFEQKDLIIVLAALAYNISPLQSINEWIFNLPDHHEEDLYDEVVHDFDNDYDRENPIYRHKALQEWIEGRNEQDKQGGFEQEQQAH